MSDWDGGTALKGREVQFGKVELEVTHYPVEVNLYSVGDLDLEKSGLKRAFWNHLARVAVDPLKEFCSLREEGRNPLCSWQGDWPQDPRGIGRPGRGSGVTWERDLSAAYVMTVGVAGFGTYFEGRDDRIYQQIISEM